MSCKSKDDVVEPETIDKICQRLIKDDYDPIVYPRDNCLCFTDAEHNVLFAMSGYSYQKREDSLYCDYSVKYKPSWVSLFSNGTIINGVEIKCNCE